MNRVGETSRGRSTVTAFLRLLSFIPAGGAVVPDHLLREVVLPGLLAQPGVTRVYAGRTGATDVGPRIVVSVWDTAAGGLTRDELGNLFPFEQADEMTEVEVEVMELTVSLPFDGDDPRILRVFRGQTRPGELERYVDAAREGTFQDVSEQHGPAALFLAVAPPDRFVTVSVWTAWDHIEAATGGNLRQPIATRNTEWLLAGSALHYEIVPNSLGPAPYAGLG